MTAPVHGGQVWADNDPRSKGRTFRIVEVRDGKAECEILTNSDEVQEYVDEVRERPVYMENAYQDRRGKSTLISVKRFTNTMTGYTLIGDES